MGNVKKETKNKSNYTFKDIFDAGYDSVVGVPSSKSVLNFDEAVVYHESALLPKYLIVYEI